MLGLATFAGPHLVILDEPTNHLDIDSRAALIDAINDYPGAVILVSHDRYLLEATVERLWSVDNGGVAPYDGDLNDYRRRVLSDRRDEGDGRASRSPADTPRTPTGKRSELASLKKRIAAAEETVKRLTAQIEKLDAALAAPDLFAKDPAKGADLARQRTDAAAELVKAEEDWLALSGELEASA
jgi:ATP-binding cassette subfamily F protein 3